MGVLHEEVIARLADSRGYSGPTRAEFDAQTENTNKRLVPLEAVIRTHSVEIDELKRRL
jgi:hypothetical protein